MKIVALGGVVVLAVLAACTPDIPLNPPPDGGQVFLGFDPAAAPPVIPLPNDLAISQTTGKLNIPADAGSPAYNEFIATYLDQLNGFPTNTPGGIAIQGGDLDPTTVNSDNLVVFDEAAPSPDAGVPVGLAYDSSTHAVAINPPTGGWAKGHHYIAIALTGVGVPGSTGQGLKDTQGNPAVATATWALARSENTLVNCPLDSTGVPDLSSPECQSTTSLLTSAQAVQLEPLRLAYKPALDGIVQLGVPRANVGLLWTFLIASLPEATFDPNNGIIPFPNNLLLSQTTGLVNLPIPPGAPPQLVALYTGLNTLDGFSTSAAAVSCNSTTVGAIDPGLIEPASLAGGVGFFALSPLAHPAQVKACLNCVSSSLADGGPQTSPQRLQFVPTVPLDEKTPYAAYISEAVTDTNGKNVVASANFAVLRLTNPVYDGMHSTLPFLTDAQAQQAEGGRQALSPLLDALGAHGLPRPEVALAWAYTTETTVSALKGLHDYAATAPSVPLGLVDVTASVLAQMGAVGLPTTHICATPPCTGKIFSGELVIKFLLTGPAGTIDTSAPLTMRTPLLLTLPTTAAPGGGYPVTIFGHGLTGNRTNTLAIADSLAAGGRATIAIDTVWHGSRSTCTGVTVALPNNAPDDAACADPVTQMCDEAVPIGRCIARDPTTRGPCNPAAIVLSDLGCQQGGQGYCLTDAVGQGLLADGGSICAGGDFLAGTDGQPAISGWNMINPGNFFGTRDNFRQQVTDLSILRAIVGDSTTPGNLNESLTGQGAGTLSPSEVTYGGQSLGGIIGTLYTSVAPEITEVLLNVPGGNLPDIVLTSPAFDAVLKQPFLAGLAALGIFPGTPQYDDFIGIARWVLDPADPVNAAWNVLNSSLNGVTLPATRKAFVQYIDQDEVIPNPTTVSLLNSFQKSGPTPAPLVHFFSASNSPPDPMPPVGHRHAFLLDFVNVPTTAEAQAEAVKFLDTGLYP